MGAFFPSPCWGREWALLLTGEEEEEGSGVLAVSKEKRGGMAVIPELDLGRKRVIRPLRLRTRELPWFCWNSPVFVPLDRDVCSAPSRGGEATSAQTVFLAD